MKKFYRDLTEAEKKRLIAFCLEIRKNEKNQVINDFQTINHIFVKLVERFKAKLDSKEEVKL